MAEMEEKISKVVYGFKRIIKVKLYPNIILFLSQSSRSITGIGNLNMTFTNKLTVGGM